MNSPIGLGFCSLDRAMPVWLSLFLLMRYFTDLRRSHIFILKKVGDGSVAVPGRQKRLWKLIWEKGGASSDFVSRTN